MFTAERDVEEDVDVGVLFSSGGPPLEPEDCASLAVSPGDFGARVECIAAMISSLDHPSWTARVERLGHTNERKAMT